MSRVRVVSLCICHQRGNLNESLPSRNLNYHAVPHTAYVERLVQYLAANKIEEPDQQRAVLLSVCGPATYRLIRNLVSPKKPH